MSDKKASDKLRSLRDLAAKKKQVENQPRDKKGRWVKEGSISSTNSPAGLQHLETRLEQAQSQMQALIAAATTSEAFIANGARIQDLAKQIEEIKSQLHSAKNEQTGTKSKTEPSSIMYSTPKSRTSKDEWTPRMSQKDAEVWSRNSAWKNTVYHVTSTQNVQSIIEDGFKIGKEKNFGGNRGRNGIYVGTDTESHEVYSDPFFSGDGSTTVLSMKLNVRKIASFTFEEQQKIEPTGDVLHDLSRITGLEKEYLTQLNREKARSGKDFLFSAEEGNILNNILKQNGYDGAYYEDTEGFTLRFGGSQIVVFDPKNITVFRSERVR